MTTTIVTLAAFGVAVGANNLAVAITLGAMGQRKRRARILLVFAAFEFLVPLAGAWLGAHAAAWVAINASWIGPTLLAALGIVTLATARSSRRDREKLARSVTTWRGLIVLSAGLSTDNLVVGFGLGLGDVSPLAMATTVMCCSIAFAWIGLHIGDRVQRSSAVAANVISGSILLVLAGASLMNWI